MYFHIVIHVRPQDIESGRDVRIDGRDFRTLSPAVNQTLVPFALSFEQVAERLGDLPRFFLEPDGSFVWVVPHDGNLYQLDGSLWDDGRRLLHAELKGSCDEPTFELLLRALGWPAQPLMFQHVQQGVFFAEDEFRRFAFQA